MKLISCIFLLLMSIETSFAFDVYLLRHFDKLPDKGDPALNEKGWARSELLALHFQVIELDRIYSTDYQRTHQSVSKLAALKNMQVTLYDPKNLADLSQNVISEKKSVLIVGHSNTTPELIRSLGGPELTIEEHEYGRLYRLRFNEKRPAFSYTDLE